MNAYQTIAIGLLTGIIFFSSPQCLADDVVTLNQQARSAYQNGDYAKAADLLEQVLKQQHDDNVDTVISMTNLAQIYQLQGRYDLAKNLFAKALPLNIKLLGEKNQDTLSNMNNLAELYRLEGDFDKAEPLFVKTLKIRTDELGETHTNTLISMNNLAALYRDQGYYELAEPLLIKALKIRSETLGKKHPDTLLSMNNLAGLYTSQGRYDLAEALYKEDLQLSIEVLGEKHPDTLTSFNNLARLYQLQGRYDLAEPLFVKNLQLCKEVLGEKHRNTISSMNNLAILYKTQGRYELAEPLLEQALAVNKEILGENHPITLISMNNLAGLYKEQEKYDAAQSLYEQSVQLSKTTLGEQHPDTIERIGNLASLYELQKKYALAEQLYQQTLQLSKKVLGEKHPQTLLSMNNLAWFYFSQQQYKKSEKLLIDAKNLSRNVLGEKHPTTLAIMANLAEVYQATEQWHKAEKLWQEHLKLSNEFLNKVLWGAGEKTRLAYLQQQENYKNNYLSFYSFSNNPKEAFYFSLTRKGQLLKIASEINMLAKSSQQPEIKSLVEKFTSEKQLLANLMLSGKSDHKQQQVLENNVDNLEMQLSQKISPFQRSQKEITANEVLGKLADHQVLIDFLIFKQVDFKNQHYQSAQLIALVTDKKHGVSLIKLGDMQLINDIIKTYRKNITEQSESRKEVLNSSSKKLYNLIWQPLLPHLSNKNEIFLIPDGNLHLLPFKALLDNNGHYLAESKQIKLLTSARDIVLPAVTAKTHDAVIFAAPDFGEPNSKNAKINRNVATQVQDIYFAPLSGAAVEGKEISELMKAKQPIQFFQGQQASEAKLATIHSPRFLHFATHGFFLENRPHNANSERAGVIQESTIKRLQTLENPLMRSGLALAEANFGINGEKQADGTDGILTALKVLALDLRGTELVTLSACETGVGDIQVGEGVYSLNRAFQEAGAKAVLSTLWSIDDEKTQLFMQDFYSLLSKGLSAQDALQKTQLKFIHQKETQDPFFWAGFTVVGI